MRLTNFSVTNFRSITAAHKINISDTTVLIGKNNEGKSNLLKALQVAMNLLQSHAFQESRRLRFGARDNDEGYTWKRDFPIQHQERKTTKQTIFKLEFLLDQSEIEEFKGEIGSNLNGSLPLEVKIGKDGEPSVSFKKSGKNTKALSSKSGKIAKFVAERIYFNYIPAVRTDREALNVVSRMLSQELRVLERNDDYKAALEVIQNLQQPILEDLAQRIQSPLSEFLPNISNVQIEIPERSRRAGVRQDFNVIIDDGTPTNIEYKGDGVKSLAALGLLKNKERHPGASIIAIEEPESHLHPGAIHQLNEIIRSLSETNQVIISTHNPLFVDRTNIKTNIIVENGKAVPAKDIKTIRSLLGILASDNLTNANFALVVEGESDAIAMKAILSNLSGTLRKAIRSNLLVIDYISGAGKLNYKLSLLRNSLCHTYTLLDNDQSGQQAFLKACEANLSRHSECTFVKCNGLRESELEDCFDLDLYKDIILEEYGVDLSGQDFKGNSKWSSRLENAFNNQGKHYDNGVLKAVKIEVTKEVEKKPEKALSLNRRNSIDALVSSLERMVDISD
ncbi:MAG: ATP-dependent nuclease [Pseudomonadota bacterium]